MKRNQWEFHTPVYETLGIFTNTYLSVGVICRKQSYLSLDTNLFTALIKGTLCAIWLLQLSPKIVSFYIRRERITSLHQKQKSQRIYYIETLIK